MTHERRVFVDLPFPMPPPGDSLELFPPRDILHHLRNVLRIRPGNLLTLVSKVGGAELKVLVTSLGDSLEVKILGAEPTRGEPGRVRSLIFALSKGDKNDLVCEKACELGVRQIIFWQSARSVVNIQSKGSAGKLERWSRIAEAAARQSTKTYIPEVLAVTELEQLLRVVSESADPSDRFFCCSLSPAALPLRSVPGRVRGVHLLVGPEGDLTPQEEEALSAHRFELVSLGPYVLRSETAAIAAIAMVHGIWGSGNEVSGM